MPNSNCQLLTQVSLPLSGCWSTRLLCCFLWFALASPALAQIYRYQDENGRWHYTDKPPKNQQDTEVLAPAQDNGRTRTQGSTHAAEDLASHLHSRFRPSTDIAQATLAVVKIEAPLGTGSGFFVSPDGYLITNKHVVKPMKTEEFQKLKDKVQQDEAYVEKQKAWLEQEEKQLKQARRQLKQYKADLRDGDERGRNYYELQQARYEARQASFDRSKAQFDEFYEQYEEALNQWHRGRSKSVTTRQYTIVLKDRTKLTARLIESSKEHDLALLKLTGKHQTPFLKAAPATQVSQGMDVYAIGSPLGLNDYVTRGILTNKGSDQLVTDAQILPGNSGGPLLTSAGDIIGINTQRLYAGGTVGSEGFGLAVPYAIAAQEFAQYLRPSSEPTADD